MTRADLRSTADLPAGPIPARTVAIADPGDLLAWLPAAGRDSAGSDSGGSDSGGSDSGGSDSGVGGTLWLRRGDGMVGIGRLIRREFIDMAEADRWWRALSDRLDHHVVPDPDSGVDLAALPGIGPLAFGSFTFDPGNTERSSVLVVPEIIIGRRQGVSWITRIGSTDTGTDLPPRTVEAPRPPGEIRYSDGALSGPAWEGVVAQAVARIQGGELAKVVLAKDLWAEAEGPIDPRWALTRLAAAYQQCWTFQVDDMIGASPEMLIRREEGLATSRVLAGTIRRTSSEAADLQLAAALSTSSKDLAEHEYAVASVARALAPYCTGMNVPDVPYVLTLPNVLHLASDVTAVARGDASALAMAGALHPSAAVCGTPTEAARAMIAELEHLDRGRYSGPVGWVDAAGDGEWAIALRCGRLEGNRAQLFAGCGIVAESEPEAELSETVAKLVPMRDALES
ncbi:isochorismate synthase [Granulicoccus phenolivorans]|uniref:isochorismate synthase n=1 Tax=Granulicoccus phenolivorans TaxID=266854 RepID=UPI000401CA21|nr:isochorismate synthase [Granulicoccus phenolivorans]